MRIVILILLLLAAVMVSAQQLDDFLQNVEQHNPRLTVLQKWIEAEETRANTGIYPDNPEVSYSYLFGNAAELGDQQEFEIMQSLKLPGYYSAKSDLQQLQFEQKKALQQKEKLEILHAARTAFFNLVWLHKKEEMLEARKNETEKLAELMNQGFETGEISRPALDKAKILNMNVVVGWQQTLADIQIQKKRIEQMSGGMPAEDLELEYPSGWILQPVDSLLARLPAHNPDLLAAQLGTDVSQMNVSFEKKNRLPSFEAGYRSEKILNQKLQGVHAGIEIPLWENKNRVKQARIESEWNQAKLRQTLSEVKTEVVLKYNEIKKLQSLYHQLREMAGEERISDSSLQLLQAGRISFPEYLMEVQFVWDLKNNYLEKEKEYYTAFSALKQLFLQE